MNTDNWITRDEARAAFSKYGLSYASIERHHIYLLMYLLGDEFAKAHKHPDSRDFVHPRISKKLDMKHSGGRLLYAHILMNGSYFKKRQCISFEPTGFIGFCGWASDGNTQPVLRAFMRWCCLISPLVSPVMNIPLVFK